MPACTINGFQPLKLHTLFLPPSLYFNKKTARSLFIAFLHSFSFFLSWCLKVPLTDYMTLTLTWYICCQGFHQVWAGEIHWLLGTESARKREKEEDLCQRLFDQNPGMAGGEVVTGRAGESLRPRLRPPPEGYAAAWQSGLDPRTGMETCPSLWLWTSSPYESRRSYTEQWSRRTLETSCAVWTACQPGWGCSLCRRWGSRGHSHEG